jgi:hypothetical protein
MGVLPCGVKWCDVYDMTPWKAQCSFEGTGRCGAQAAEVLDKIMDKTKIAKMDMAAFREMKELEAERDRWRDIANGLLQKWCANYGISRDKAIEKYFPEFKDLE